MSDPGYRVIVQSDITENGRVTMPAHTQDWQIEYAFLVPPLPGSGFNPDSDQVIYVWGDIDFDDYGAAGSYPLSDYRYNQIVPQVMTGNCYTGSGDGYKPGGVILKTWGLQAQYFWLDSAGTGYVQCGNIIPVTPGEKIQTIISYNAAAGLITARIFIAGSNAVSSIIIDRPFPNEPALFSSWKDFFAKAETASGTNGPYAHPVLNVEPHNVKQDIVCGLLPFTINGINIPGVIPDPSYFSIGTQGNLSCPGSNYAVLNF